MEETGCCKGTTDCETWVETLNTVSSITPESTKCLSAAELIENNFKYHKPKDENTMRRHEAVRDVCKTAAYTLAELCPNSPEQSLAIRKLEEAMMWANAAIARYDLA